MIEILGLITSPLRGLLAGITAVLGALLWGRMRGAQSERQKAATEALKDATKRQEAGRKSVQSGRASGDTPDQRVRKNDGRW